MKKYECAVERGEYLEVEHVEEADSARHAARLAVWQMLGKVDLPVPTDQGCGTMSAGPYTVRVFEKGETSFSTHNVRLTINFDWRG